MQGKHLRVFERVDIVARHSPDRLDIVCRVHRAHVPHGILIERTEQVHLDDDTSFGGLGNEIFETFEISRVPPREIKFVSAVRVAGRAIRVIVALETLVSNCQAALEHKRVESR